MSGEGSPMMTMPSQAQIAQDVNCQLLGTMFNWCLYGALAVQMYHYAVTFPNDRIHLKLLIWTIFLFETAHTAVLSFYTLNKFGNHFGDFPFLTDVGVNWLSVPFFTSLVSGTVQLFLIRRIYELSRRWIVPLCLALLSLVHSSAGLAVAILGHMVNDFRRFQEPKIKVTGTVWITTGAASDVFIALFMAFYLSRMRTGFERTENVLNKLIRLMIETGSVTATTQVIMTVLFFAYPGRSFYLTLSYCLSKLYCINLLLIQNSRTAVASGLQSISNNSRARSSSRSGGGIKRASAHPVSIPISTPQTGSKGSGPNSLEAYVLQPTHYPPTSVYAQGKDIEANNGY